VSDRAAHNLLNSLNESSLLPSFTGGAESFLGVSLSLGDFVDFGFVEPSLDGDFGFGVQPTEDKHSNII
jgi:hypothetical protein